MMRWRESILERRLSGTTAEEYLATALSAMDRLDAADVGSQRALASAVYAPTSGLSERIEKMQRFLQKKKPTNRERQQAGYLMEEIAVVAFGALRGTTLLKSYSSPAGQIDLQIGGDGAQWVATFKWLAFSTDALDIVVEAKAQKEKVSAAIFSRLCALLSLKVRTAGLGIFLTLNGATGFPRRAGKRVKGFADARFWQALFYARERKPVIVFDWQDVRSLGDPGSLPILIREKVREVENMTGVAASANVADVAEVSLPSYLEAALKECGLAVQSPEAPPSKKRRRQNRKSADSSLPPPQA